MTKIMSTKRRREVIMAALIKLGGIGTTRQIAEMVGLNVNGVAKSLGAMYERVGCLGGRGGDTKWQMF